MDGRPEKVWDGRGEALSDARITQADGRMADDMRLKCLHFRVMAHIGRQNALRGWLRVSQSELAKRWDFHRNSVNRAFMDLVEWGYLLQRTQHEAGESFCQYKVSLDGEVETPASALKGGCTLPLCTPDATAPAAGVHTPTVHTCTVHDGAPVHTPTVHPIVEGITTRAHRLTPTNADSPPPPRKRGGREGEVETILDQVKAGHPGRVRPVDLFLGPLVRQREFRAPSKAYALGVLADWPLLQGLSDADYADLVTELKAGRGSVVVQANIEAAVKARAGRAAEQRRAADEAQRKAAAERAALARLAPDVEPDAAPQRREALALRRAVLETAHDGADIDDRWLGDLIVVARSGPDLRLAVGQPFAARHLDGGYINGVLVRAARSLWPDVVVVSCETHAQAAARGGRAA